MVETLCCKNIGAYRTVADKKKYAKSMNEDGKIMAHRNKMWLVKWTHLKTEGVGYDVCWLKKKKMCRQWKVTILCFRVKSL